MPTTPQSYIPEIQSPDPTNPLVALRGQVIRPQDSQRVQTAAGIGDQTAQRVAAGSTALPAFNTVAAEQNTLNIPQGSPLISSFGGPSANVQNLTNLVTQRATDIGVGLPSRSELAAREFDLYGQQGEAAFNRSLDRALELNAAAGRSGSGLVTRDLADITAARSEDLAQARESLALRTAGQELQDRLGVLASLSGVQGQLSAQDLAQAGQRLRTESAQSSEQAGLRDEDITNQLRQIGLDRTFRDEQRGERAAERGAALEGAGLDLDVLGALTGRESVLRGEERAGRNELRGERARADELAEIANARRIQQLQTEAAIQSQLFQQLMARAGLSAELGFGGTNILDAVGGFSDEAGRQGSEQISTGREALNNYFLRQILGDATRVGETPGTIPTGGVLPTGTDLGIPEFVPEDPRFDIPGT